MAGKKKQDIRFDFSSANDLAVGRGGKFRCSICFHDFTLEEIEISINGFTICPNCILFGPSAVAAEASLCSQSMKRLVKWGGSDPHPDDIQGIREQYLIVVNALRGIGSWYDFPGGAVAVAIAKVHPEDTRRGYRACKKGSTSRQPAREREILRLMESMKTPGKAA